ncbi:unnamed protein product, partial [Effrenium voratum]
VTQLPDSVDHAQQVLSRTKELSKAALTCCSKHFAEFCFAKLEAEKASLSRDQLLFHVANVATSLKTGVVAGMSAACATTTMTVRTPIFLLGRIRLGFTATQATFFRKLRR